MKVRIVPQLPDHVFIPYGWTEQSHSRDSGPPHDTFLHGMERPGSRYWVTTLCVGFGQGITTIVEGEDAA